VEFIGSNHPYYDAEVIALEMTFLKALGLTRPRLEINSVVVPSVPGIMIRL
jgi:histidyl-tRNA synthetase